MYSNIYKREPSLQNQVFTIADNRSTKHRLWRGTFQLVATCYLTTRSHYILQTGQLIDFFFQHLGEERKKITHSIHHDTLFPYKPVIYMHQP